MTGRVEIAGSESLSVVRAVFVYEHQEPNGFTPTATLAAPHSDGCHVGLDRFLKHYSRRLSRATLPTVTSPVSCADVPRSLLSDGAGHGANRPFP